MLVTATLPDLADLSRRRRRSSTVIVPAEMSSRRAEASLDDAARSALGIILSETKRLYQSSSSFESPTGLLSLSRAVSSVSPDPNPLIALSNSGNPIGNPPLNSNEYPSPNTREQSHGATRRNPENVSTLPPYSILDIPVEPSNASWSMRITEDGILTVLP